ncbi:MAG: type VI secretion system contractile sheath large subunit [Phycisphaerales bacterium]|nr:type VI secretion system contractile sheath large subunit [Phycisphaerales bacterium]
MAEHEAQRQPQAAPGAAQEAGILDSVLEQTPATRDQATDMVKALVGAAMSGTVTWDKNLTRTINKAIAALDAKLSRQLAAVMHHPDFQKLEGTWRGFKYLVSNSETSANLKIRVLNASKRDLAKDLESAVEFDQSQLFKKMYEGEYGQAGGEPFGALIGDYEFSQHPEDIEMLQKVAGVAAAAFCPFISAGAPKLFGLENFTELGKPRDLEKIFQAADYTAWRSFRDSDDSRFVTLAMPRVLARLPFGANTKKIDEFAYEEGKIGPRGESKPLSHDEFTWMNAAYVLGTKLTDSFAKYGWCTTIRGTEGGGKVEGLPTYTFTSDDGDADTKCPTEVAITDRREAELSKLGFLPLCHYKNTDYAVFFGGQTVQKPKTYDNPAASANARLSAGLPYIMASSRIAHYLKVIGRDKIGSKMERGDVEDFMKRWLAEYICADAKPSEEMKAKYPLAEARVEVVEVPGKPGVYNAVAWLRPWLFLEELNASLRLVASIPKAKG